MQLMKDNNRMVKTCFVLFILNISDSFVVSVLFIPDKVNPVESKQVIVRFTLLNYE